MFKEFASDYYSTPIEDDSAILHEYARWITDIEFTLQELWNFEKNINFHKFWETPKCRCAKMDNDDNYPYGYYSISGGCPLHGGFFEKK
jgi:hypothetical protein